MNQFHMSISIGYAYKCYGIYHAIYKRTLSAMRTQEVKNVVYFHGIIVFISQLTLSVLCNIQKKYKISQ